MTEQDPQLETFDLGVNDHELELHDLSGIRDVVLRMTSQARRQLLLFTQDLAPDLYDQQPFLTALQSLALKGPSSHIQILVIDSQKAIKNGHRLVEMARHLSSRIELRRPIAEYRERGDEYLLVDDSGFMHRHNGALYEAVANFSAPLPVRHLEASFREAWEHSEPDPELRRLFL